MRSKYVLFLLMTVSNIVSECVTIMHAKVSLCQNDICSSKSFQITSKCTIWRPCFQNVLCSSKSFQIPSECTLYLVLDLSLKFQISISNSVRMFHFTVHVFKIIRWGRPTTSRPLTQNPRPVPANQCVSMGIIRYDTEMHGNNRLTPMNRMIISRYCVRA